MAWRVSWGHPRSETKAETWKADLQPGGMAGLPRRRRTVEVLGKCAEG